MREKLDEILSDLDTLTTRDAFQQKFGSAFAGLGFEAFTYLGFDLNAFEGPNADGTVKDILWLTNQPPEWAARYIEEQYGASDPVLRDCISSRLPIVWTKRYRADSRDARATAMFEDALSIGIRCGLTIPVRGPGGEIGIFSLTANLGYEEFLAAVGRAKFDVQIVAHHFQDAVRRTLFAPRPAPPQILLTVREIEVLGWTAKGKVASEIATLLNISEHTVNFHIQNATEKLGANNKTHAAAKAMQLGILPPLIDGAPR